MTAIDGRRLTVILALLGLFATSAGAHSFQIPDWENSERWAAPANRYIGTQVNVPKTAVGMLGLGIHHILDPGAHFLSLPTPFLNDHGLLLLGLLLMNGYLVTGYRRLREQGPAAWVHDGNWKPWFRLAELATAFAVGHTTGLFFVLLSPVTLPGYIVEAGIALSIAIVGLERLAVLDGYLGQRFRRTALLLVGVGFWHGNGFAPVVRRISVDTTAAAFRLLLPFSIGVDIGQLLFMLAASTILLIPMQRIGEETTVRLLSVPLIVGGTGLFTFRFVPVVIGAL